MAEVVLRPGPALVGEGVSLYLLFLLFLVVLFLLPSIPAPAVRRTP